MTSKLSPLFEIQFQSQQKSLSGLTCVCVSTPITLKMNPTWNKRSKRVARRLQQSDNIECVDFLKNVIDLTWASEIISLLICNGGLHTVLKIISYLCLSDFVRVLCALFQTEASILVSVFNGNWNNFKNAEEDWNITAWWIIWKGRLNNERMTILASTSPLALLREHNIFCERTKKDYYYIDAFFEPGLSIRNVAFNPKFKLVLVRFKQALFNKIQVMSYSGVARKKSGQILFSHLIQRNRGKSIVLMSWSPNGKYVLIILDDVNVRTVKHIGIFTGRLIILKYVKHQIRKVEGLGHLRVKMSHISSELWVNENSFMIPTLKDKILLICLKESTFSITTYFKDITDLCWDMRSNAMQEAAFCCPGAGATPRLTYGCIFANINYANRIFFVRTCSDHGFHDQILMYNIENKHVEWCICLPFLLTDLKCHGKDIFVSMIEPSNSKKCTMFTQNPDDSPKCVWTTDLVKNSCAFSKSGTFPWIGETTNTGNKCRLRIMHFKLCETTFTPIITDRLTNEEQYVSVQTKEFNKLFANTLPPMCHQRRNCLVAGKNSFSINEDYIFYTNVNVIGNNVTLLRNHHLLSSQNFVRWWTRSSCDKTLIFAHPNKPIYLICTGENILRTIVLGPEATNEEKKQYPQNNDSVECISYNKKIRFIEEIADECKNSDSN